MRQLFPDPRDVDPIEAYGRTAGLRLNMIASIDGAAAIGGRSAGLGGAADKAVFAALRCLADVILVGAGTMRDEHYGPARLSDEAKARRRGWGLPDVPPIAVVTRSCRLDWDSSFFADAEQRPLVLTTASATGPDRVRAAEVADVIVVGDVDVDLGAAKQALGERGHAGILAEGGPAIAAELAAADLLDEICLTVAPLLVAGEARRMLDGPALVPPASFSLAHVLENDRFLFLRYCRASGS